MKASTTLTGPVALLLVITLTSCQTPSRVGRQDQQSFRVATLQRIRPAGEQIEFTGRPVDLALSGDGNTLFVKDNRGLVVIDLNTRTVQQALPSRDGSSMRGLAVAPNGSVWFTDANSGLHEARRGTNGAFEWARKISLPQPKTGGEAYPCGLVLSRDGTKAWVCLSRNNALGVVDLKRGEVTNVIDTGIAPYDVALSANETRAFVTCWGGRRPVPETKTQASSGTDVEIDERGVVKGGTVSFIDLAARQQIAQIDVGLQPSQIVLHPDRRRAFVANANSDDVNVIDVEQERLIETIAMKPDPKLLFGSAPNALAISYDGDKLYVANGGNNAVAVISLGATSKVEGFIPMGWYPGALLVRAGKLFVANTKGVGSRLRRAGAKGWNVADYAGTISVLDVPAVSTLADYTDQVLGDARVPEALRSLERSHSSVKPVPVPRRLGEPSVFKHVVYVIKENRTYDQLFGDLRHGDGDPRLCIFGREVTPNHHALAEQFVLLDNYYCNGVVSADGHAWSVEGNATSYFEKSFGGWTRSYPFGDDPLAVSASGFIWDNVLKAGLTFRNYGEFDYARIVGEKQTFKEIHDDFASGQRSVQFQQNIGVGRLRGYSDSNYPGWNMKIPDVLRAQVFIDELGEFTRRGEFPAFTIVYLPQDHTTGTSPGAPTPRAHVADNDLALGRVVEALSKSPFWKQMAIFVIEDDPQAGFDHVDGHRSLCLVISPYTKRGKVVSKFYNQTSVVHTMERILRLPPMNQMDAMAPLMFDVFQSRADFRSYVALPNRIPLDELNPPLGALLEMKRTWALKSLKQNFEQFDKADEDTLNRILWHAMKGVEAEYPANLAGPHGQGLRKRGLALTGEKED